MSLADIPHGPHWAIVSTTSITIPGDERSRTHPGHGYPEHTETFITYQAFTSEDEWLQEIETRTLNRYAPSFRALKVEAVDVRVRVEAR
jgi:hypothetical protein